MDKKEKQIKLLEEIAEKLGRLIEIAEKQARELRSIHARLGGS